MVGEDGVAFDVAGFGAFEPRRVGEHGHDFFGHGRFVVGKVDSVAEALAHLGLAIGAGESAKLAIETIGQGQDFAIKLVKALHDFAGLLNHRALIVADRDKMRAESRDVGDLGNGVAEKAHAHIVAHALLPHLVFHGRVAFEAREGDEVEVVNRQFSDLRYERLNYEGAELRVEADREVIKDNLADIGAQHFGRLEVIGESLHIGDENIGLIFVLQLDAVSASCRHNGRGEAGP